MGLFTPGKIRVSLYTLEKAMKKCMEEHSSTHSCIITDIVIMGENHPDNVWAREKGYPEHFMMVEFEYDSAGHVAGYGIDNDGNASCFYD